jgi:hypothetical protein
MRQPSARCMPHRVKLIRHTWSKDLDGGRVAVIDTDPTNVSAFVQPGRTTSVVDSSDHQGLSRVTEVVPTRVFFTSNVGLNTNDLIEWIDPTDRKTHVMMVLGFRPPCATLNVYTALCEESK